MNLRALAKSIISMLTKRDFYAQCPRCDKPIPLAKAKLFYFDDLTPEGQTLYDSLCAEIRERRAELKLRKQRMSTSQSGARGVNFGCILEQLAPSMGNFPYQCGDCRSLFKPIDYVIFRGLTSKGTVDSIVFCDIKTGQARLTPTQRQVRSLIEQGQVEWDTYSSESL